MRWNEAQGQPSSSARSQPSGGGAARRGARGNQPFYKVNGVRYRVLDSSLGYTERGVASWYGKKFHGRTTSSGEIYDMYGMTAAHKALPLPTRVRVRHLGNGKSVVVTVNDRGPFIHNRIIDLSYAAASELDMIGTGTALVEIVALAGPGTSPKPARTAVVPLMTELEPADMAVPPPAAAQQQPAASETRLYLQVGAFGDPINARQLRRQLQTKGLSNVVIRYDLGTSPTLYRVRLGPIADVAEYDALVELMAAMQIVETHLVTESGDAQLLDLATTMPAGAPDRVSVSGTLSDG
ncbi:MAG: septal ring lytic transglycosylase RlpA family protein [Gammaproteobacteria bacterium]